MKQLAGRFEADQRLIDRLVDGELSEDERRQFLEGLEEEPAKWRQVALGFIESQCCTEAFDEMLESLSDEKPCSIPYFSESESNLTDEVQPETNLPEEESVPVKELARNSKVATSAPIPRRHRAVRFLPVVASVAVAFSLGFVAQSRWSHWADRASRSLPVPNKLGNLPVTGVANQLPGLGGGFSHAASRKIDMPLIRRSDSAENWLNRSDRVVSPELEQSFSRYGHRVSEKRRVYPVQLKDGRRILVPVKDVELQYMGNRGYH